jgi:CLIP-associating protein 1/2
LQRAHLLNQAQAPERPTEAFNAAVQVYEDPFTQEEPVSQPVGPVKPVLEEIAINERTSDAEREALANTLGQSTRSNEQNIEAQRNPLTPAAPAPGAAKQLGGAVATPAADQAQPGAGETLRNRRLLTSAIERVRAKTLDAHGFRRVQELVKAPAQQDIWGADGQRFADLLLALLDYLETPADGLKALTAAGTAAAAGGPGAGKAANLKTQVLATVRAMLALHRRAAAPHYPRALCAVLRARARFDDVSHLAAEAERACDDMARAAPSPGACLDAVLGLVEGLAPAAAAEAGAAAASSASPRTVKAALATLAALLDAAAARGGGAPAASPAQTRRLGAVAVRLLQDADAEVRRADLEFCLALHERLGGAEDGHEEFWKAVDGAKESGRNLITYYLARRGRGRA